MTPIRNGSRARTARIAAVALLLSFPLPSQADLRVDAGIGLFSPYSGDQRAVYGASPSFASGFSSAVGNSGARMFLDLDYVHGSGSEFAPDPTFEVSDDATYDLFPVRLGVRFDLNQNPEQDLRVFLGIGLQTAFTRWKGSALNYSGPSSGAFVELRPEYRAGDTWSLWVRQRLDLMAEIDYGPGVSPLNYSGSTLSIGVSFSLDHAPLTPPRNDS